MLAGFTAVIMIIVAYFYLGEGLFTAFTMCVNVFVAGLVAFNFWEPAANWLEPTFAGGFLEGSEDALCLVVLFCVTLGVLRALTNNLVPGVIEFPASVQQGGGVLFGLVTGYLVAGFLVCVMQTLPWHENFLSFEWKYTEADSPLRRLLPADRVWLALLRRAGAYPLANQEDNASPAPRDNYEQYLTFDKYGTFELRYQRYRRYGDTRNPLKYSGELDREIHRPPHN